MLDCLIGLTHWRAESLDDPDKVALHVLGGGHRPLVRRDDVLGLIRHQRGIHPLGVIQRLSNDANRLTHLLHADQVAIVGVAMLAERHFEVQAVVDAVRGRLADIVVDAGATQARARQRVVNGHVRRNDADTLCARHPDRVGREELGVLRLPLREDLQEVTHHAWKSFRDGARKSANLHHVRGQARAAECLEEIENQLALTEAVERHGERADVERVGSQPDEVGSNPRQLGHDHAPVLGAFRRFHSAQLLERQHAAEVVHRRGDIVCAVGPGNDLRVAVMLAQLLRAAVQVANDWIAGGNQLTIQRQDHAQHAVRARVLRTHIEGHQPLARGRDRVLLNGQRPERLRIGTEYRVSLVGRWRQGFVCGAHIRKLLARSSACALVRRCAPCCRPGTRASRAMGNPCGGGCLPPSRPGAACASSLDGLQR